MSVGEERDVTELCSQVVVVRELDVVKSDNLEGSLVQQRNTQYDTIFYFELNSFFLASN